MLELNLKGIKDFWTQDALANVQDEFRTQDLLNGKFKHFEIIFTAEVVNYKFPHKLGFRPKDAWFTSQISTGTLSAGRAEFNYSLFDSTNIDITTTGAVTVRFFVGTVAQGSQA